jgi:hypothetical protein
MTIPTDLAPEITSTLRTIADAIEREDPGAGVALAELGRSIAAMQAPAIPSEWLQLIGWLEKRADDFPNRSIVLTVELRRESPHYEIDLYALDKIGVGVDVHCASVTFAEAARAALAKVER